MRFKVVYYRTAWVIPNRLQVCTAATVLASMFVARQCLSSQRLPMFRAVKRAGCIRSVASYGH